MNKVFLSGRLVKTPEIKTTPKGTSVCTLRMATRRHSRSDESDFHTIIVWDKLAEICDKYLVKGQRITVVGEIRYRDYEVKDGAKQYRTEILAQDIEFGEKPKTEKARSEDEERPF